MTTPRPATRQGERRRTADPASLQQAKHAAWLISQGVERKEIAEYLDISLPTLARRLELASEAGILRTRPEIDKAKLTDMEIREFELYPLYRRLRDRLRGALGSYHVPRITVVPSEVGRSMERLSTAAALRLLQHAASRMSLLGVAWGVTLRDVVNAVKRLTLDVDTATDEKEARLQVAPIAGDLLLPDRDALQWAPSTLAAELAAALHGTLTNPVLAPAYIPVAFFKERSQAKVKADRAVLERFLQALPGHHDLFGPKPDGQPPLIHKMDAMIAGVGVWDSTSGWLQFCGHIDDDERERLKPLVIGDLAGRFVVKRGVSKEDRKFVEEEINDRVFVPSWGDLERCAQRARSEGTLGPMIVARRAHKAEVLVEICRNGWVAELIVDEELASKMCELLDVPGP